MSLKYIFFRWGSRKISNFIIKLKRIDACKGEQLYQVRLSPLRKAVYSKRKEFAPWGSKFFPFIVDPFLEDGWCAVTQTVSYKSCLPCKKIQEIYQMNPVTLMYEIRELQIQIKVHIQKCAFWQFYPVHAQTWKTKAQIWVAKTSARFFLFMTEGIFSCDTL